jgi:hypothetical protein
MAVSILFHITNNRMKTQKLGLVGKIIFAAGTIASLFSGDAEANTLSMALNSNVSGVQKSSAELTHHSMPEQFNYSFISGNEPAIDIFYLDGTTEMKGIGNPADSMETETAYIRGRGLSEPINAQLNTSILTASIDGEYPENNFTNKNIFADLYTSTGSLVGTYNVKDYSASSQTIPITVSNGLSYYLNVRFEKADKFGFKDLERFASYWIQECNFNNANCEGFGKEGYSLNFIDFADFANKWEPVN